MVNKPGRRKQSGHRKAYEVVGVAVVIILIAVGTVQYATGDLSGLFHSLGIGGSGNTAGTADLEYAKLFTSQGTIEVVLFPQSAPKTVANFISLAESGFYDNLVWHRIATNPAVIQTGDPLTRNGEGNRSLWGTGGSSMTVPLEVSNSSLRNAEGYLGMARGQNVNSGSSQFYINTANNFGLDGQYTVFGKVISGMSAVQAIASLPLSTQYYEQPASPSEAMLLNVTVVSNP